MNEQVLVVIGAGGMGEAIARRLGSGRCVVLGDASEPTLHRVERALAADGFQVVAQPVDVGSRASVRALAERAAQSGSVGMIAHTAGLSPAQADSEAILRVNLYGTAVVLEEFGAIVAPGGAGLIISSMSAHLVPNVPAELERAILHTPTEELLGQPSLQPSALPEPGITYALTKRGNALQVMAASVSWGKRRARINAISPGIILTPMGQQELASNAGARMRAMVAASGTGRAGTPSEIAEAAAFLLGQGASFITGIDLLVDGGVVAALRSAQPR
jgi:NAD(P)-dependent dehydrogenase (short-subunit alcohol dehydrogenase family)